MEIIPPNFKAADDAAQKYLQKAEEIMDDVEVQRALVTIGTVFFERATHLSTNFFKRAHYERQCRHYLEKSIESIPHHMSSSSRAEMELRTLLNLINLECLSQDASEPRIEKLLARAKEASTNLHSRTDLCSSYISVIKFYISREDFVAAQSRMNTCLSHLQGQESEKSFVELNEEATKCKLRLRIHDREFDKVRDVCANILQKDNRRKVFKLEMRRLAKLVRKMKACHQKLQNDRQDASTWEELGDLYDHPMVKLKGKAMEAYQSALAITTDPEKEANLYYSIGILLEEQGHFGKARDFYEREISKFPKSAEASALGSFRCACSLNEPSDSIMSCIEAVRTASTDPSLLDDLDGFEEQLKTGLVDKETLGEWLFNDKIRVSDDHLPDQSDSDSDDSIDDVTSPAANQNQRARRGEKVWFNAKGL